MKKLICIILGLFLFTCSYGQAIINRSGPANTVQDARWMSQYNAFLPRYNDTTAANLQKGIDSCGAIIFTYDIAALWFRSCSNGSKQWVQICRPLFPRKTRCDHSVLYGHGQQSGFFYR